MSAAVKLGVKEGLVVLAGLGAVAAVPVVVMSSADVQQRPSLPAHDNASWQQQQQQQQPTAAPAQPGAAWEAGCCRYSRVTQSGRG